MMYPLTGVLAPPLLSLLALELSLEDTLAKAACFDWPFSQFSERSPEDSMDLWGDTNGGSTSSSASSSSSSISGSDPPTEKSSMSVANLRGVPEVGTISSVSALSKCALKGKISVR